MYKTYKRITSSYLDALLKNDYTKVFLSPNRKNYPLWRVFKHEFTRIRSPINSSFVYVYWNKYIRFGRQ